VLTDGETFNVLKNKIRRIKFTDNSNELSNQSVTWIVKYSLPHERETLTRGTAENYFDRSVPNVSKFSNLLSRQSDHGPRNDRAFRKIELMNRCMYGIDLYGGDDIEPSLFEAKTEPAGPRKQIYTYWPWCHHSLLA